jgi:hypothetical protein
MGNIPLVALAGRPPQIRDFGELQRLNLENENLRGQNALQPGQLEGQQNELKQQQMQLEQLHSMLEGNKALVRAQHDPEWNAADPDQVVRVFKRYDVPLPLQMQVAKGLFELQGQMQNASKESLAMSDAAHSFFDEQIQGAKSAPPDMREKAYQEALGNVRNYISRFPDGAAKNAGFQELASAPPLYDEGWIDRKHGVLKTQKTLLEEALKRAQASEAEGKGLQATAESNLILGKIPGVQAESAQKQQEAVMTPQERALAGNLFYGAAGGSPQARRALQLETAQKVAAASAAYANAPAALKGVPPHLIPPATAAATKAGEEYAAAKSVSDRMAATMAAARKGNVVSYQIIPQEGTLQITTSQGVHRINRTEIEQYAGGGSLWQRLEGHLGKQLTGRSIPGSVLNDMQEIQKIQADGSKSKYENALKTINQNYGSSFQPVEMGGGGEAGFTRIRASDGTLHDIPTANLEKARQRDPKLQVVQ